MQTVRAHFDGDKIQLEEPLELKQDDKLLVTKVKEYSEVATELDIELASLKDVSDNDFLSEEEINYYKSLK